MMIRSFVACALSWLVMWPVAAGAHPQEPKFNAFSNAAFIPRGQDIGLSLAELPRKSTLFQWRMKDDQTVESCKARFVKQDSPLAIQGCKLLIQRFSLPQSEGKKRRTIKLNFNWPEKTETPFESDFGGAIPLLLHNWISTVEMRTLARSGGQRHEFVLNAEIGADGSAANCSIDNADINSDLRDLICQQFVDHSFWIPAFDQSAGVISTQVSLHSKIETGRALCSSDKGASLDLRTGVFRWAIMEGGPECLPDFRDFVAPPAN